MNDKFISMPDLLERWNIKTRGQRRKLLKVIQEGRFTIHAKHPVSGKVLPYKITHIDLKTEKITGHFLDS